VVVFSSRSSSTVVLRSHWATLNQNVVPQTRNNQLSVRSAFVESLGKHPQGVSKKSRKPVSTPGVSLAYCQRARGAAREVLVCGAVCPPLEMAMIFLLPSASLNFFLEPDPKKAAHAMPNVSKRMGRNPYATSMGVSVSTVFLTPSRRVLAKV
jgi:hypothetical protein